MAMGAGAFGGPEAGGFSVTLAGGAVRGADDVGWDRFHDVGWDGQQDVGWDGQQDVGWDRLHDVGWDSVDAGAVSAA